MSSFSCDGITYWLSDQDSDKMFGDRFGPAKKDNRHSNRKWQGQNVTNLNGVMRLGKMLYQLVAYQVIYL